VLLIAVISNDSVIKLAGVITTRTSVNILFFRIVRDWPSQWSRRLLHYITHSCVIWEKFPCLLSKN